MVVVFAAPFASETFILLRSVVVVVVVFDRVFERHVCNNNALRSCVVVCLKCFLSTLIRESIIIRVCFVHCPESFYYLSAKNTRKKNEHSNRFTYSFTAVTFGRATRSSTSLLFPTMLSLPNMPGMTTTTTTTTGCSNGGGAKQQVRRRRFVFLL